MSDDKKNRSTESGKQSTGGSESAKAAKWFLAEHRKNLTSEPGPIQAPPTAQFKPTEGDGGGASASGGQEEVDPSGAGTSEGGSTGSEKE